MRIVDAQEALEQALAIRLKMLWEVGSLPEGHAFSEAFIQRTARYLATGEQTTLLAMDGEHAVGCATICYMTWLPSLRHPTGCRAHLMNVYTAPNYRRQGLARRMVEGLMDDAKKRGVTEISLDATVAGRPLYEALGFQTNDEGMTIVF